MTVVAGDAPTDVGRATFRRATRGTEPRGGAPILIHSDSTNSPFAQDRDSALAEDLSAIIEHGVRDAHEVETEMTHIDDAPIHDEPIIAFGGSKQSGVGRLNEQRSLDEFTGMKRATVNRGHRQAPN